MKIIHVSTQTSWGGGEKQVWYLMQELRAKGVEQILLCPKNSALALNAKEAGFEILERRKTPLFVITWGLELTRLVKKNKDAILHAHDAKAHNCTMVHALRNARTPIVVHRRIVKKQDGFYTKFKFNHPAVRKIICISSAVRESLIPIVTDASKFVLIPSGIKRKIQTLPSKGTIKTKIGIPTGARLILNIGSLLPQKQQLFFLQIAHAFFEKNPYARDAVYFAIMGEGPMRKTLESFISENELTSNCLMLGFLKNSQEILSASDILLSTSVDEALGNVVMEAFLAGVPVIASKSGGVRDLIEDQKTGFLAEDLKVEAFLSPCEELLKKPDLRAKIAAAALLKLEEFDIAKTSESMYRVYLSIQTFH